MLIAHLFRHPASSGLFFQGGTALRWCYGGSRFSEDLDFESCLAADEVCALLAKAGSAIRRDLVAHLGPGRLELQTEGMAGPLGKAWVRFAPANFRGKIAVKLEFQRIVGPLRPDTQPMIMGTLPAVAQRLQGGSLKTDPHAILLAETLPEIMAGKLRALLERPAYKGRDFWDIWFLEQTCGVKADPETVARKIRMYDFTQRRSVADVLRDLGAHGDLTRAQILDDLKRFVPAAVADALESTHLPTMLASVHRVLASLPDALF
ncbi:MAG: nucleotidyl transferase AbiEii/AbiGii toxin family protein [Thermodesulfobacteriota bacterium]